MRDSFGKKLLELTKRDSRVYAIDCDLANSTKVDYVAKDNPSKFIQLGIAEQNAVTMAAGMATTGLQPWVTTFTSFLTKRALDQIVVSVAQPELDVKLIGAYSGLLNSRTGKTHQGIEDIAIMRTIPNMKILCPADGFELEQMMDYANNYHGPVYIRLSRQSNDMFTPFYTFNPDKAVRLSMGNDITILSTGTHSYYAEKVSVKLKYLGYSVGFLHVPVIKPIDINSIININSRALVTIEDHTEIGGFGSAIAEIVSQYSPKRVLRIGIKDTNIECGSDEELLDKYGLSVESMKNKIIDYIENN